MGVGGVGGCRVDGWVGGSVAGLIENITNSAKLNLSLATVFLMMSGLALPVHAMWVDVKNK